jgi:hypothetical protein
MGQWADRSAEGKKKGGREERWAGGVRWAGRRKTGHGNNRNEKKERLGGGERWASAGLKEENWRWAVGKRGRESEVGRGKLEGIFRTLSLLNFCFFKPHNNKQKPMQSHECIKHLVNFKFKCYLI